MKNNIVAIIQARIGATRLPGKVLMLIGKKPMLQRVIESVKRASLVDKVMVATSDRKQDNLVARLCKKLNIKCFRGSEEDVLERYYGAAKSSKARIVVRITSDCPFIEPLIIDEVIKIHLENKNDYTANDAGISYPRGTDVEVFNFKSLERAYLEAKKTEEREHVTPYFYKNQKIFKVEILKAKGILKRPEIRLCVDTKEDLAAMRAIFSALSTAKKEINIFNIIDLSNSKPELLEINAGIKQKKLGE